MLRTNGCHVKPGKDRSNKHEKWNIIICRLKHQKHNEMKILTLYSYMTMTEKEFRYHNTKKVSTSKKRLEK